MKRATVAVLLLFTLSGISGLVYQITWIRMLSHLLGGTSYAISTVLAAFMGGLALGSRHFGALADRTHRPLALYARLEFGIAALGLLVYVVIRLLPPVYATVAGSLPAGGQFVLRLLIAGLLIVPPTFLMGGTLPVLSRFAVTRHEALGRSLGLLYAVNTFGAVLGCFLAGFVLIATLGILGSTIVAIVVNLLIGLAVLAIERRTGASGAAETTDAAATDDEEPPPLEVSYGLLATIFALSGCASLGYELYWTRALQHFLGNSTYAFSAMLTTFLLGLAFGGWAGGRLADRSTSPARVLGWIQFGTGACALGTVWLIWQWLPQIADSAWLSDRQLSWTSYLGRRFLLAFAIMAAPTFLTGMTFPLVNRIGIASLGRLGTGVGRLYFYNTVGSILGALAAGFVVLPWLGAKRALIVTALLSMVLGLVVHLRRRGRRGADPWVAAVLLAGLVGLSPTLRDAGRALLADTQDAGDVILFQREDHAAETKVYRKATGETHMSVDGHHIGGTETGILRKEKILAHLPMVLNPTATRTLSVGLGSGITLGAFALYEQLEALHCVEIVPGVVEGADYFAEANRDVMNDPRLDMVVGDGVQYLLTTRLRYDIISSDSKLNPEYSGNAPLLSVDYYELCRARLADGGVMVQWLGINLPHTEIASIARSFASVFPHVGLYWSGPSNIVLAGAESPLSIDIDASRRFFAVAGLRDDLASMQLENPYGVASLWICNGEALLADLGEGAVNTWQHPHLEFSMLRSYRTKSQAYHEDDNARWLYRLHDPASLRLVGDCDVAAMERFGVSGRAILAGYAAGGGVQHLRNGREHFDAGLVANPDDARLRKLVADLDAFDSQLETVATAGGARSVEDLVAAGVLRRDQGRHREALDFFERACAAGPDNPGARYNRLLALKSVGRLDAFATGLAAFREDFPADARSFALSGRQLAESGDAAGAVPFFERAVELDPQSPVHRNNLASTLGRLGRWPECAVAYDEVCRLEPTFPQAAFFAAAAHSMASNAERAAHWSRFAIDEELSEAALFRNHDFFVNLRASEYWDEAAGEPK